VDLLHVKKLRQFEEMCAGTQVVEILIAVRELSSFFTMYVTN
jgi:hypothetical protein